MPIKTIAFFILLISLVSGCAQQPAQPVKVSHSPTHQKSNHEVRTGIATTHTGLTEQKAPHPVTRLIFTNKNESDLWQRLRDGLELQAYYDNPGIEKQVAWYSNSQSYIDRVMQRGQYYLYHIIGELEANDMPLELAMLPAVESAFDPIAYSHSHASGLWQFIPATGTRFGLKRDWWYDGRRDPLASTTAAIQYLKYLHNYFDGDWLLALAAYNSGEGNVKRAIKRNQRDGKPTDFWSLRLPRETRAYVPQLLAISRIVDNPAKHSISLPKLTNQPYFTKIDLPEQIDLSKAADMAGIETKEIYRLNAGYSRRVTHPDGPHQVLLPISNVEHFKIALSNTPQDQWAPIKQYVVKSGDTLSKVAYTYHVPIRQLRSQNGLKSDFLKIGQKLKIPGTGFDNPMAGTMAVYTVKNGDSLWKISKKKHVSIHNIAKWNSLDVKSPLKLGQVLKIQADGNTGSLASTRKLKYKVRKGDSLYRIADKFNLDISDILEWNKLNPKKYLKPGQRITLFVDALTI